MFRSITPVLPVPKMSEALGFWRKLGFDVIFADKPDADASDYAGVRRGPLTFHLQTTMPGETPVQSSQFRIWMEDLRALETLHTEWEPHKVITAPLGPRPWGNTEFGLYAPGGAAFFFCVDTPTDQAS